MAGFELTLVNEHSPEEALRRVLDLRRHSAVIPFTRVSPPVELTDLSEGDRFVARTGLGPIGFDDVMVVREMQPTDPEPSVTLVKEGRAIRGRIDISTRERDEGSVLVWRQEVVLPWLPGWLHGPAIRVIRLGYRRALRTLLA